MSYSEQYFATRITTQLPKQLFTGMREVMDYVYFEANRRANEKSRYDGPERRYVLGMERHWLAEMGFRELAERVGMTVAAKDTMPPGGRYSLGFTENFLVGRASAHGRFERLRANGYRTRFAEMNAFSSVKQGDLFSGWKILKEGALYGLFIAGADKHEPSVPAFLNFAIPDHRLDGWLFNQPVEKVLAYYSGVETAAEIVPDMAAVKLKDKKKG